MTKSRYFYMWQDINATNLVLSIVNCEKSLHLFAAMKVHDIKEIKTNKAWSVKTNKVFTES